MSTPKPEKENTRRVIWITGGLICLCVAGALVLLGGGGLLGDSQSPRLGSSHTASPVARSHNSSPSLGDAASEGAVDNSQATRGSAAENPAQSTTHTNSSGPEITRAARRDTVVTPSGQRKQLVDPMATWENTPPWPEGPRLFAEVETSSRRYVNLRPDDAGDLPRIFANAEERIELRVNFPEGEPGEKIYVELPNGGSFPDTEKFGRVFELPANRTLSFPYISDEALGYCTVMLRHRGHSRSLPIWVGEPPAAGS